MIILVLIQEQQKPVMAWTITAMEVLMKDAVHHHLHQPMMTMMMEPAIGEHLAALMVSIKSQWNILLNLMKTER